jgi:pimeloyl-ACP methyl ester carboxylesterase
MLDVNDPHQAVEGVRYTERTVTTRDGVALAVREYGSRASADHTVVLLHGLCLDQTSWDLALRPLLRRWGRKIRVITYDHRGHGRSGHASIRTYRIDQAASDLADVLAASDVTGPLTLAGHSMGGMIAQAYLSRPASKRPADPVGLILVATAAGKITERGMGRLLATPAVRLLCGLAHRVRLDAAERVIQAVAPSVCAALARVGGFGDDERAAFMSTSTRVIRGTSLTTAGGFLTSMRDFDKYSALGAICAQTTVISGELDVMTPPSHAYDMAEAIPGATHSHVVAAGHMLLHEAPDVVNAAITDAITTELNVSADRDLDDLDAAAIDAFGPVSDSGRLVERVDPVLQKAGLGQPFDPSRTNDHRLLSLR